MTPPPVANAPGVAEPAIVASALEQLRFTTPQFTPAGLAYDAVSRRFVVGDRAGRKLAVVDEFSQHVANLAGAQTSGFGDIAAVEIDARQGNLWVVSSGGFPDGAAQAPADFGTAALDVSDSGRSRSGGPGRRRGRAIGCGARARHGRAPDLSVFRRTRPLRRLR